MSAGAGPSQKIPSGSQNLASDSHADLRTASSSSQFQGYPTTNVFTTQPYTSAAAYASQYPQWHSTTPASYAYQSPPPQGSHLHLPSGYPLAGPDAGAYGTHFHSNIGPGSFSTLPLTSVQHSKPRPPTPSPSPSPPPPETYRYWDAALKAFFRGVGLHQTLRGFESDMLVMNERWEQENVPKALEKLIKDMSALGTRTSDGVHFDFSDATSPTLEERKLGCVHLANGSKPRPHSTLIKDISQFLAKNRAKNDASNRAEFLLNLAEKKRKYAAEAAEAGIAEGEDPAAKRQKLDDDALSSCARTDAKPVDRDLQMKYDVAKNEEGPLSRTVAVVKSRRREDDSTADTTDLTSAAKNESMDENKDTSFPRKHPGLTGRILNIETHLGVKYVPSPPRTLLMRLQFLEEHIIKLEKDYPPWSALHFNQPRRGWPPPPRATPIIVPPHQREVISVRDSSKNNKTATTAASTAGAEGSTSNPNYPFSEDSPMLDDTRPLAPQGGRNSSLRRAVLQRLEVQKAMSDLGGPTQS